MKRTQRRSSSTRPALWTLRTHETLAGSCWQSLRLPSWRCQPAAGLHRRPGHEELTGIETPALNTFTTAMITTPR